MYFKTVKKHSYHQRLDFKCFHTLIVICWTRICSRIDQPMELFIERNEVDVCSCFDGKSSHIVYYILFYLGVVYPIFKLL